MMIINYLKYLTPQKDFDIKIEFENHINLNIISNIIGNRHNFIFGFNGYYSYDTENIDYFFDTFFHYKIKRIYSLNQRNWHCVLDNEPHQLKIANKVLNHWKKWFLGRMKERNDPIKRELMKYCYHPSRVNFELLI